MDLAAGGALDLTVGEYLTADGTSILGEGVKPDVRVADDPGHRERTTRRSTAALEVVGEQLPPARQLSRFVARGRAPRPLPRRRAAVRARRRAGRDRRRRPGARRGAGRRRDATAPARAVVAELGDPERGPRRRRGADLGALRRARLRARELEDEAADAADRRASAIEPERRDLTALDTFTVDPETARDFDDAVSASADGDGIRLWIHIADVAAHVRPGTALDARGGAARATASTSRARSSRCCRCGSRPAPAASRRASTGSRSRPRSLLGADGRPGARRASTAAGSAPTCASTTTSSTSIFAGRAAPPEAIAEPLELARRAAAALARRARRGSALEISTDRARVRVRRRRRRGRGPTRSSRPRRTG